MPRCASIASLALSCAASALAQSTLDKVTSLRLPSIEGSIATNYSEGYEVRAKANSDLLGSSTEFFESKTGISRSLTLARVDSNDWQKITNIPYGLPFVSGPPYVVCVPADSDNALARYVASKIHGHNLNRRFGVADEEIVSLYLSLIGFHELGHIYANANDASFPNKWTFEFAATYFAYLYLDQNRPEERDIWIEVSKILIRNTVPQHTELSEFEEKYVRVGVENYAWYQIVFLMRVKEVYQQQGHAFLGKLKDHRWREHSTSHYLADMEEMAPGFNEWAREFNLAK